MGREEGDDRSPEGREENARAQEGGGEREKVLYLQQGLRDIFPLDGQGQNLFGDMVEEAASRAEVFQALRRPLVIAVRRQGSTRGDGLRLALVKAASEAGEVRRLLATFLLAEAFIERPGREGGGGHAAPIEGVQRASGVAQNE